MSNKCGDCVFFEGANKCGAGKTGHVASSTACSDSFKGPASLFNGKKCGGCKLFNGAANKCGAGKTGHVNSSTACSDSYAPIPG